VGEFATGYAELQHQNLVEVQDDNSSSSTLPVVQAGICRTRAVQRGIHSRVGNDCISRFSTLMLPTAAAPAAPVDMHPMQCCRLITVETPIAVSLTHCVMLPHLLLPLPLPHPTGDDP
jgi:hypothetical protein